MADEVVRVVRGEWDTECPHDCWTGMEGPANTLPEDVPGQSRWPLLWVCGCGTLGVTTDKGTVPVRARVLLDPDRIDYPDPERR